MRKWLIAFGLAAAASLAARARHRRGPRNPEVNGIPLSSWLYGRNPRLKLTPKDVETLRSYGSKGATWLIWAFRNGRTPQGSNGYDERRNAAWALGYLGVEDADPAVLAALMRDLRSDRTFERVSALNRMLPASLPVILQAEKSRDLSLRCWAIYALGLNRDIVQRLSPAEVEQITSTIKRALRDPSVRGCALSSMAHLPDSLPPIYETELPIFIELLKDPEPDIRRSAAVALYPFGSKAADAIEALLTFLSDSEATLRRVGIVALSLIDREGHFSKEAISKLTADPDKLCRAYAEVALAQFSTNEVDRLIDLLLHSDPMVRVQAIRQLTRLGATAAKSAPAILDSLRSPRAPHPRGAIVDFQKFGDDVAIASWIEGLAHPHTLVQQEAAEGFYYNPEFLDDPKAFAAVQRAAACAPGVWEISRKALALRD